MQTAVQTAASTLCVQLTYSYSLFLDLLVAGAKAVSIATCNKIRKQALPAAMCSCKMGWLHVSWLWWLPDHPPNTVAMMWLVPCMSFLDSLV